MYILNCSVPAVSSLKGELAVDQLSDLVNQKECNETAWTREKAWIHTSLVYIVGPGEVSSCRARDITFLDSHLLQFAYGRNPQSSGHSSRSIHFGQTELRTMSIPLK